VNLRRQNNLNISSRTTRQDFSADGDAFSVLDAPLGYMRPHQLFLAGLVIAVLAISACSSSTDTGGSALPEFAAASPTLAITTIPAASSTAETSTSITTTAGDPRPTDAELAGAVDAFWTLFLELGAIDGPFDAATTRTRLAERTTGDEMVRLFDLLQGNALAGYVIRGEIDSSLEVVSVESAAAEVRDCYDDTTGTYRIDTGERVDTDNPNRHQVLFALTLDAGVWKVARVTGEGDGCVAAS